jgi:hypothetical protein
MEGGREKDMLKERERNRERKITERKKTNKKEK